MENSILTITTSTHNQPSFNLEQTQSLVHPAPVIGHHGVEPPNRDTATIFYSWLKLIVTEDARKERIKNVSKKMSDDPFREGEWGVEASGPTSSLAFIEFAVESS